MSLLKMLCNKLQFFERRGLAPDQNVSKIESMHAGESNNWLLWIPHMLCPRTLVLLCTAVLGRTQALQHEK